MRVKYHSVNLSKYSFLVTGGAGFIGSHLCEYLCSFGAGRVVILDNLATGSVENIKPLLKNPSVEFIEGDIRDYGTCLRTCKGIDFVLHQAALGSVPRSIADPVTTNEVNVAGFVNILTAAKEAGVKRFVYAASSSTYGDSKELPKVEERIGKPLSPYAVSKYANELYAEVFASLYQLEIVGLRYFNVFGPRQNPEGEYAAVIPLFINAAINKLAPTIFGDGEQTRDFTYVENVVQANIRAVFSSNVQKAKHEIMNIACGDSTSLNQLWNIISKLNHLECSPIYKPGRNGDVRDSLASVIRAKEVIDYTIQTRIEEGLEKTFRWFDTEKKLTHG